MDNQAPDRSSVRVFFFGDSICFGQGVSIHKGWVTRISAESSSLGHSMGTQIVVINASVNGNTTRQALERMPYEIQSQHADILIVQFGLNDSNYWESDRGLPRVSPGAFRANLEEIVARAFNFHTHAVVLNTNHPVLKQHGAVGHTTRKYSESVAEYNEIIRVVASSCRNRFNVILSDIESAFLEHARGNSGEIRNLLLPDLVHLSEAGHHLYFSVTYPLVRKCIEALAGARSPARSHIPPNADRS